MAKELEDLFESVGSFGPYQKWMVGFVLIPTSFIIAYVNSASLFQLAVPDHWCNVPGRATTNMSLHEWKNLTIPRGSSSLSKCHQYKLIWENGSNGELVIFNETESCTHGWEHDTHEFVETVATTNGWFCDRGSYSKDIISITTMGNAIGTLLIPVIADRYVGRRIAFYLALGLQALFTAAVVWAPSYEFHLAFRFLAGLSYQANYQMPYMTVLEFVSPEKRAMVAFLSWVSWIAGLCFSSLVAWVLPDWRYQALACCVPVILCFMYIFCLPESPRWLLTQGRLEECIEVFTLTAVRNGMPPPERSDLEGKIKLLKNIDQIENSQWKVIRYPKLCLRSLMLFIIGPCAYIIKGVLSHVISIHPNYFLNSILVSVSELPGIILGCLSVHHLGRRFTFILTFFLTSGLCLIAVFVLHDEWMLLAGIALIQLFTSQIIFTSIVYNAEIFPTSIRSTGFAWISMCGFTAMTASSYIMNSNYGETFPYWVIFALSGACFLASLPLPETIGLPLPQTFQEAEDMGDGRPLKTWIHKWNYSKYLPPPDDDDNDHDGFPSSNKQELKALGEEGNEENVVVGDV